jgi:hypothetical protein
MSRTRISLIKQIVVASALALGASGPALADEGSTHPPAAEVPADSNGGRARVYTQLLPQNPCPQAAGPAATSQKKDEQKIAPKNLSPNRGTPITSPTYFNQYPGQ